MESDRAMLNSLCSLPLPKPLLLLKADDEVTKRSETVGCVQAYEPGPQGKVTGRFVLEPNSAGVLQVVDASFVDINSQFAEDAKLKMQIEKLYKDISPAATEVVATSEKNYTQEEMAQWLADSYRVVTHADISVVNLGVAKSGLGSGPVTRENLRYVFPYVNQLMGLDWSVEEMSKALCRASMRTKSGDVDWGSEIVVSGAKLVGLGTSQCRLESPKRGRLKVVIDDYLFKKSARWLGQDLTQQSSWRFGVESTLAIEERIKRDHKAL
jgi:hypothetical protein